MSSTDQTNQPVRRTSTEIQPLNVTRSPNWRVIYTNGIGLGFGENEVRLNIGFDQNPTKPNTDILEEAVVVMNHRAAKMLVYTLGAVISSFEALNGPIALPVEKLREIDNAIKAQAQAAIAAAATATAKE